MRLLPSDCWGLLDKESPLDFASFERSFLFLGLFGRRGETLCTALPKAWGDLNATSPSLPLVAFGAANFFLSLYNLTLSLHFHLSMAAFLGLRTFFLLSIFRPLSLFLYFAYISAFALILLLYLLLLSAAVAGIF